MNSDEGDYCTRFVLLGGVEMPVSGEIIAAARGNRLEVNARTGDAPEFRIYAVLSSALTLSRLKAGLQALRISNGRVEAERSQVKP